MYFSGRGIERNLEEAIFWLKKAIENGYKDAEAIMNLIKVQHEMTI
jgi:TPR repeat protein